MPQMAPMSWLLLFFLFTLSLMIFTILNYPFMSQMSQITNKATKFFPTSLTWKW